MKRCLPLLLVGLLVLGCTGCKHPDKESAKTIVNQLHQALQEQMPNMEPTAAPPTAVAQKTPQIPAPDEGMDDPAPSSEEQPLLCYVLLGEDVDGERFNVLLDDVVWVSWDNAELIAKYGLEDAWFDNDFELYNAKEAFIPATAFKNGDTEFFMVNWEDEFLQSTGVPPDEFIAFMQERSVPILADVTMKGKYVTAIRERYVP